MSVLFTLCLCAVFASALSTQPTSEYPTRLVYEFGNGSWVENIAVRSNGQLLVTRLDEPELWLIDPSTPQAKAALVERFSSYRALFGIIEYTPESFALIAGNYSATNGTTPGSYAILDVNMTGVSLSPNGSLSAPPPTHTIARIPSAQLLNGMSYLTNSTILVSDLLLGNVLSVDVHTGAYRIVATDPLMGIFPSASFGPVGIDGLHVLGSELYFANAGSSVFARLPIDPSTGEAQGNATVVSMALNSSSNYDDFTFGRDGRVAYLVTGSANSIEEVNLATGRGRIVAGSLNSTDIAEPTAVAFGRGKKDSGVLYVVTGGGLVAPVDGDIVVGGQVVAVEIGKRR